MYTKQYIKPFITYYNIRNIFVKRTNHTRKTGHETACIRATSKTLAKWRDVTERQTYFY